MKTDMNITRTTYGYRFQDHYVYGQFYIENNRCNLMVWVKSTPPEERSIADAAFSGDSHEECMAKLKEWLYLNKDWVN